MSSFFNVDNLLENFPIKKILIANNGLFAVKCINSIQSWMYMNNAKNLIKLIVLATQQDLDSNLEYIHLADQYVIIPSGPSAVNYNNIDLICEKAEQCNVDAVWVGWGYTSENSELPQKLAQLNISFIGPNSNSIRLLGNKTSAFLLAQSIGIPVIPWNGHYLVDSNIPKVDINNPNSIKFASVSALNSDIEAKAQLYNCKQISQAAQSMMIYPLLIKAADSGGGRGIRLVNLPSELMSAIRKVQAEAPDSSVMVSSFIKNSKHIEVQIIGDMHGNVISLLHRDCSTQRRYQKLIEEAPASSCPSSITTQMENMAVSLAKLCGYYSVGTAEFLYNSTTGRFFFLEFNPRIQVEHPCTEMLTNINIPICQLLIASGYSLRDIPDIRNIFASSSSLSSSSSVSISNIIEINNLKLDHLINPGHVIACRIVAENPQENFAPSTGLINDIIFHGSKNVWGYFNISTNGYVHEYMDSQLGHIFAWGEDREKARINMLLSLKRLVIKSEIITSLEFLISFLEDQHFIDNQILINKIDLLLELALPVTSKKPPMLAVICACIFFYRNSLSKHFTYYINCLERGHIIYTDALVEPVLYTLICNRIRFNLSICSNSKNSYFIVVNNSYIIVETHSISNNEILFSIGPEKHVGFIRTGADKYYIEIDGANSVVHLDNDCSILRSTSAGKIVNYLVEDNSFIECGKEYVEIEVMKMILALTAPRSGIIKFCQPIGAILSNESIIAKLETVENCPLPRNPIKNFKKPLDKIFHTYNHSSNDIISFISRNSSWQHNSLSHNDSSEKSDINSLQLGSQNNLTAIALDDEYCGTNLNRTNSNNNISAICVNSIIEKNLEKLNLFKQPLINILSGYCIPLFFFDRLIKYRVHDLLYFIEISYFPLSYLLKQINTYAYKPPTGLVRTIETIIREHHTSFNNVSLYNKLIDCICSLKNRLIPNQNNDKADSFIELFISGFSSILSTLEVKHQIHKAKILLDLVNEYISVEKYFSKLSYEISIENLLKENQEYSNGSVDKPKIKNETILNFSRSHSALKQKNQLILMLIDQLHHFLKCNDFNEISDLIKSSFSILATFSTAQYSQISLKCSKILITFQRPRFDDRIKEIETTLSKIHLVDNKSLSHFKELDSLINCDTAIFDVIINFFFHSNHVIRISSLEVYIRRALSSYIVFFTKHYEFRSNNIVLYKYRLPKSEELLDENIFRDSKSFSELFYDEMHNEAENLDSEFQEEMLFGYLISISSLKLLHSNFKNFIELSQRILNDEPNMENSNYIPNKIYTKLGDDNFSLENKISFYKKTKNRISKIFASPENIINQSKDVNSKLILDKSSIDDELLPFKSVCQVDNSPLLSSSRRQDAMHVTEVIDSSDNNGDVKSQNMLLVNHSFRKNKLNHHIESDKNIKYSSNINNFSRQSISMLSNNFDQLKTYENLLDIKTVQSSNLSKTKNISIDDSTCLVSNSCRIDLNKFLTKVTTQSESRVSDSILVLGKNRTSEQNSSYNSNNFISKQMCISSSSSHFNPILNFVVKINDAFDDVKNLFGSTFLSEKLVENDCYCLEESKDTDIFDNFNEINKIPTHCKNNWEFKSDSDINSKNSTPNFENQIHKNATSNHFNCEKKSRHIFTQKHLLAICHFLIENNKPILLENDIKRVTFTFSRCSGDLPLYFSFLKKLNYKEGILYRNLAPSMFHQLELSRLKNYNIKMIPSENHSLNIYLGTPKISLASTSDAFVKAASNSNDTNFRFFVRVVLRNYEHFNEANSLEFLIKMCQIRIMEIMEQIEVSQSKLKIKSDCNHIFFNILSTISVRPPDLIDGIFKLIISNSIRLWNNRIKYGELKFRIIVDKDFKDNYRNNKRCNLSCLNCGVVQDVRLIIENESGYYLKICLYKEVYDSARKKVMLKLIGFKTIVSDINFVVECDALKSTYLEDYSLITLLQKKRFQAHTLNTTFVYDLPDLIKLAVCQVWKQEVSNITKELRFHLKILKIYQIYWKEEDNYKSYVKVRENQSLMCDDVGVVTWLIRIPTKEYLSGRKFILVANNITHYYGSFGLHELKKFRNSARLARKLKIPLIYYSVNSGARIGLSSDLKDIFKFKLSENKSSEKVIEYLYIEEEDYNNLKNKDIAHFVKANIPRTIYIIKDIYGEKDSDYGVKALQGSAMVAREMGKCYEKIFTLSYISKHSVGIGAYLVRLGRRIIQRENSPIILTGANAINRVLGTNIYHSNHQLGGPQIMFGNGTSQLTVSDDYKGICQILKWLSYVPSHMNDDNIMHILKSNNIFKYVGHDPVDRKVEITPLNKDGCYNPRLVLNGYYSQENSRFFGGIFDSNSFVEYNYGWARGIITGRAKLGNLPVGVIISETQVIYELVPPDPADKNAESRLITCSSQVLYPSSSFKLSQSLNDFKNEKLPVFIFPNWRGFSGGMKDMYHEVIKYGAMIFDSLRNYEMPIFVCLLPGCELRGGAWAIVDPNLNPENMEIFACPFSRANILEPDSLAELKFKKSDISDIMNRYIVTNHASSDTSSKLFIDNSQIDLKHYSIQASNLFASLHDSPKCLEAKNVISKIIEFQDLRIFFYYCLKKKLLLKHINSHLSTKYKNKDLEQKVNQIIKTTRINNVTCCEKEENDQFSNFLVDLINADNLNCKKCCNSQHENLQNHIDPCSNSVSSYKVLNLAEPKQCINDNYFKLDDKQISNFMEKIISSKEASDFYALLMKNRVG